MPALKLRSLALAELKVMNYGDLKLGSDFDPLRGDSRFQKIVASLAPT